VDRFVDVWFTVMLTLVAAVGLGLSVQATGVIVVAMMVGIFPIVAGIDKVQELYRRWHKRLHESEINQYTDWAR